MSGEWDTWTVPVLGGQPVRLLPNASGLTWIGDHQVLFSEIKSGFHMGLVTATDSRAAWREIYFPPDEHGTARYSSLTRPSIGARGRNDRSPRVHPTVPIGAVDELRRVARRRLRGESPGHALQSTALVHEAYLRLVDVDRMTVKNRTHFFALAATLMRRILVDHARRQHADKRGGRVTIVSLDDVPPVAQPPSVDVLALDQALGALSSIDERQCRVVECDSLPGSTSTRRPKRWRFADESGARMGLGKGLALSAIVVARVTGVEAPSLSAARRASDALRTYFSTSSTFPL